MITVRGGKTCRLDCPVDTLPAKSPTKASPITADEGGTEPVEPLWNQSAADVLDIVALAGHPLLHPQIVKAMAGRSCSKMEAYASIAFCQGRGWIEHNLFTGYVLSGMNEAEKAG